MNESSIPTVQVLRRNDGRELDLDRPLYRIFSLWFFEAALRLNGGNLALVPPAFWEDPYEDPCKHTYISRSSGIPKALAGYLKPAYAQCWSFEGKSDTFLRAYSRVIKDPATSRNVDQRYEGVWVRTTPRKLLHGLNTFLHKRQNPEWKIYLGAVEYDSEVPRVIVARLNAYGLDAIGDGEHRARSLLLKREIFRHEAEVRVILLASREEKSEPICIDINLNEVFEEIRFDPRLVRFEMLERKERVQKLGYKGPIDDSSSYERAIFLAELNEGWARYGVASKDT
jgi:hypothetical protein